MRTMRKSQQADQVFGLSSGQFAIFMLLTAIIIIVSIFKQLHPILIHRNHFRHSVSIRSAVPNLEKGNTRPVTPDYLTGLRIKNATPRQITDKRQIFKFILKQQP